jgi:hypothetical protein
MIPIALPSRNLIFHLDIRVATLTEMKALEQRPETSETEKRKLTVLNEIHKKKAQEFYNRKRNAKAIAKSNIEYEAIAMDF